MKKISQKICYFKAGNVVNELINTLSAKKITGGPNYYIYSTKHSINDKTQILYLSFAEKNMTRISSNCIAKTIKAKKFYKYCGLHVIKLLIEILKFRPHHIICVKRRYLHFFYLLSKIIGASFTVSVHTDLFGKRKIDDIIIHHLLKIADSVICHGPYLSNQARKIIAAKEKIIEYDTSSNDMIKTKKNVFKPSAKLNCFAEGSHIISYIGRMESNKGVIDLYNAFKELLKNEYSYELCFAGSGAASHLIEKKRCVNK